MIRLALLLAVELLLLMGCASSRVSPNLGHGSADLPLLVQHPLKSGLKAAAVSKVEAVKAASGRDSVNTSVAFLVRSVYPFSEDFAFSANVGLGAYAANLEETSAYGPTVNLMQGLTWGESPAYLG